MTKIFLSHRFTGEDENELRETLGKITAALRSKGHQVYCSIEEHDWHMEQKHTTGEIMSHAFKKLDESDILLAFIQREEKSEGMLLEIGYAIAKEKPFVLGLKKGIHTTSLSQMTKTLIEFDTVENLCEKLKEIY